MGAVVATITPLPRQHEEWTPERIVEAQRDVINHWRRRALRAEKLLDLVAKRAGRYRLLYRLARSVLENVADERDALSELRSTLIDALEIEISR